MRKTQHAFAFNLHLVYQNCNVKSHVYANKQIKDTCVTLHHCAHGKGI